MLAVYGGVGRYVRKALFLFAIARLTSADHQGTALARVHGLVNGIVRLAASSMKSVI